MQGQQPIRIGDVAPDFEADTTIGKIQFHQWLGNSWGILFSHPKDFTPVCTTELGTVAKLIPEFNKRNVKIIGLSVDSVQDHKKWIQDIDETQKCKVEYPLIGDETKKISNLYNMIHPNAPSTGLIQTVRSVFIIGPDKLVKIIITYPPSVGRNFQEILRVIDSLQLSSQFKVATPSDWQKGQDVIIMPSVSNDEAKKLFPQGFKELKPYLRYTKLQ